MKKFMKNCAIVALVLALLGVLLVTISGVGGGFRSIRDMTFNGALNVDLSDIFYWDHSTGATYNIDLQDAFDNNYEIITTGSNTSKVEANKISDLEINLGGCDVKIVKSDDEYFHIQAQNIGKYQTYVKGETLYVSGYKSGVSTIFEVILSIPESADLDTVNIELGAGKMSVKKLEAKKLSVNVGAGQMLIDSLYVDNVDISVGAGELIVENGKINNLTASIGMGNMEYRGSVTKDLDAEVAMGNLEMVFTDSQQADHNFKMECAAGNISIDGGSYTGLIQEKEIYNGADSDYHLECAMGNIAVRFR